MPSVTFSVPNKLKSKMKELSWINWSELARQEVLIQDKRVRLLEELEELTKDSKLTDEDCLRLGEKVKEDFLKRLKKEGKL